jgi:microcystin-dependent protein
MATVTGLTAERMLEIEAASVVDGTINGSGHLILTTHDGTNIDAGNALVAVPNENIVHILDYVGYSEVSPVGDYPVGVSVLYMNNTETTADWPTFAGKYGSLHTVRTTGDATQMWRKLHGSTSSPEAWIRSGNSATGWSSWLQLSTVEAGFKVQVITPPSESADNTAYPSGVSVMSVGSGSGWSLNGGFGNIMTIYQTSNRLYQTFVTSGGGSSAVVSSWVRTYHTPEGWTPWSQMATPADPATMGITGEIKMWAANTVPNGWSLCDGGTLNRTTDIKLFNVIGVTYGAGDGTTTFNKPNLKGRVPVGFDSADADFNAVGKTGGEKTHILTTGEMPSHTHIQNAHSHNLPGNGALTDGSSGTLYVVPNGSFYGFRATQPPQTTATNQSTGGGAAHNNVQPYIALKYIIKL